MKRLITTLCLLLASFGAYANQCIPSGVVDQYTYFVAVDSTDFTTLETGLSSFTVYRSRNGGAAAAFTTPTINETDVTNMPGAYELLLDEDMTIDSGDDVQHMIVRITATGMAPVTKEFCIARAKITAGETVTATGGSVNSATQSIAANAITATAIATDAITAAKIAADAIGASEIAASAIAASEIATGAITATKFAAGAIDAAAIATDAIGPAEIATNSIGAPEIADDAIGAAEAGFLTDSTAFNGADVAAILADTGTTLDAALAVVDANVDLILVDTGTTLDAALAVVDANVDALVREQHTTTIATLATQVSWTLTAGSADDDAYNGWEAIVVDQSTATQVAAGIVQDYTGSTRTVTLMIDPGVFTMATGDTVVLRPANANVRQLNCYETAGDGTTGTEWSGSGDGGC